MDMTRIEVNGEVRVRGFADRLQSQEFLPMSLVVGMEASA
jgi:hypothetical protein